MVFPSDPEKVEAFDQTEKQAAGQGQK